MILEFLHEVFTVLKFFFGLGALGALGAIGLVLLWFFLRAIVMWALQGQPADKYLPLRQLFLDV